MKIIGLFAAVGAVIGGMVATGVYLFHAPSGSGWISYGRPRRYVDYLPISTHSRPHLTADFYLLTLGGGVVVGAVAGALLFAAGVRLTRISRSSPTG